MRKNLLLPQLPLILFFIGMSSCCFAQVTQTWVARYNGPGTTPDHNLDIVTALAVDGSGNVYVTGLSDNDGTFFDIATIKYNASGIEQWVRRYHGGPGSSSEGARAIAVDAAGNVYVTGRADRGPTSRFIDYITIKYDADGNELWVRRYEGPGNDFANSIAVDASGNVFVTGRSQQSDDVTGDDTGTTNGIDDYVTIKYDADGNELWVQRFDGTGGGDDEATSLILDGSGNVFVTGQSGGITTIKYDTDGNEMWTTAYSDGRTCLVLIGNKIAVDAVGNVYVTGTGCAGPNPDYITLKYDLSGTVLWARTYNGPDNATDEAAGLVVDGAGNIYVTGTENLQSGPEGAPMNFATIKYNSAGDELWVRRYDGPAGVRDEAFSISLDAPGNIYVTGGSTGIGTRTDFATLKYNPDGVEQWVVRYNGPDVDGDEIHDDKKDAAISVKVDAAGNVYVTGDSDGAGTMRDYATIKYGQPSPLVVAAGLDLTIFQGYGSLCVTLSAEASGGLPPYEYSWIPGQFTTQNIQVCPTKTITYAVTAIDAGKNKSTDDVKVNVIDIRCGKKLDKVLVCHKGNKELCISEAEVKEHLAHGDILGACKATPLPSDNPARPGITKLNLDPPSEFRVTNYPNPVSSITRIQYEIPFDGRVAIKVYDVSGREVTTLVNSDKKAGYYKTDINISTFQTGVYYYKAFLNGKEKIETQSGKIIVIR